jgi:hypothetical protein
MGAGKSKQKVNAILGCGCYGKKKQVKPISSDQTVIKEVFILFVIFDFMPFPELIRLS